MINCIDITRLKRDYINNPLQYYYIGSERHKEKPFKEDIEYLYNELNMSYRQIAKYIGICKSNMLKLLKELGIKKTKVQAIKCRNQTLESKYGTHNIGLLDFVKEKKKKTNLERYGCEWSFQNNEIKEKKKKTNLERYGCEYVVQNQTIKEKTKQTNLERYGCEYVSQYCGFRKQVHNSKVKNKTYNKSNPEDVIFNKLNDRYCNVIRQYKSDLYPFACDFYIPSMDLYIEYNGFWKHGKEPYDENNMGHKKIVQYWKQKSKEINFKGEPKTSYNDAIYTWTIKDVKKRQTATNNNLNYLEFFNMNQFNEWLVKQ